MTTSEGGAIQRKISDEQAGGSGAAALVNEMIKIRKELGISQRKLGEMAGVKQSVIARLETGKTSPTLSTMMKLLCEMGKTLYMVDSQSSCAVAELHR